MPNISEVLAIAVKNHQAGQRQQAEQLYRAILRVNPNHPDALHLLGVIGNETGNQEMAVENISRAIALRPDIAEFHNNLGNALQAQGKFELAVNSFRRALQLMPGYATAHNNMGNALKASGDLDAAIASYHSALELDPDYATAHCNLGSALQAKGKLDAAVASYQQALRLNPNFVEVYNNLGNALHAQGKDRAAEDAIRRAIELRPDYAEAYSNLGGVLQAQGRLAEAEAMLLGALRIRPDYCDARVNLATVYQQQGKLDDAATCFLKALEDNPNKALALYELSNLARQGYDFDRDIVGRARQLLLENGLALDDAAMLHFVMAGDAEKRSDYDDAFQHYERGSDLRRQSLQEQNIGVDHEKYLGLIDQLIDTFDREYFQRIDSFGLDTELPVFVVGMPRSGTTLLEQIIASHPRAFGAGELKQMGKLVANLQSQISGSDPYPHCVRSLDRESIVQLAQQHLSYLRDLGGDAIRVVDKMPLNYNHLGLIATLFPQARVIHCRRDPLDTCVSCLRQYAIPSSLEEIATCYQQYEKLMRHWREVLPVPMLELQYEELVANPDTVIRQIIDFCGLEWSDRCLAFHETDRAVQTPTKLDVRRPMYSSSVGRWKRYERQLRPRLEKLGFSVDRKLV